MFCLNNRTTLFDHDDFETTRLLKTRPPDYEIPLISRMSLMYCFIVILITLVKIFKNTFQFCDKEIFTNIILFIIAVELLLIISKINLFIYFVYLLDDGFDYNFYKNLYY